MTLAFLFWIVFLLALVISAIVTTPRPVTFRGAIGTVLILGLIFILGWRVFGPMVK